MPQYLNSNAGQFHFEQILRDAEHRVLLVAPILKLNRRLQELIDVQVAHAVEVRFVYERNKLSHREIQWLDARPYARAFFLQDLHAKCYLNERQALLTSMSPFDYRRAAKYEMGLLVTRQEDPELFQTVFDEAQKLLRAATQLPLMAEAGEAAQAPAPHRTKKPVDWQLAKKRGLGLDAFYARLAVCGYLEKRGNRLRLTSKGRAAGGEAGFSKRYGPYFRWPADLSLEPHGEAKAPFISRLW